MVAKSMYNLFGGKWVRLHCGPMWSYVSSSQDGSEEPNDRNILKVGIHVTIALV